MANNQAFRVKNGLIAQRYLQSAGADGAGADGYNLAGASYDGVTFDFSATLSAGRIVRFNDAGTKMFIFSAANGDIYEFNLSSAYDLTTVSYSGNAYDFSADLNADGSMYDFRFFNNGTKVVFVDAFVDTLFSYTLATAYDLSTKTKDTPTFVLSDMTVPTAMDSNPSGTIFFLCDSSTDRVYQYNLSSGFNLSTISYSSISLDISSQATNPRGIAFNEDGTKFYVTCYSTTAVYQYDMTTPYSLSTASYSGISASLAGQGSPYPAEFKTDGTKFFTPAQGNDSIHQYSTALLTQTLDLSTGNFFSFTPSGATTVSFTNPPASGLATGFAVEVIGDGSAITWPSSVKWHLGTAPTATATKEIYTFITTDGGTTYYGKKAGENVA